MNSFQSLLVDVKISECILNMNHYSLLHFLPGAVPPGAVGPLLVSEFVWSPGLLHSSCPISTPVGTPSPSLLGCALLRSHVSVFFWLLSWYVASGKGA